MNSRLKLIHNSKIDIERWDKVIYNSPNSRVYAKSWMLDIVNEEWNGLIYGDYEYIMPVVYSKKWGIEYAYQPIYSQQHGIFPPPSPEITKCFIDFLIERFRYLDISLNSMNLVQDSNLKIEERANFLLSLRPEYEDIAKNYSNDCKRNVKKARVLNEFSDQVTIEEFMQFYIANNKVSLNDSVIGHLKKIVSKSLMSGIGEIHGAYSKRNQLTGVSFFLKDKERRISLCSVSSEEGRDNFSMFFIIDNYIRNNSSKSLILDFEGSIIEGIAMFFKRFGAEPETYQHIKFNRLPWPIKIFKK
ncbi:MAG: hypothetical protein KA807_05950 [Prolixibacteraceae bacterium]|nr:hypothetical protein [Prolixibacteraceae bacterium]